MIEQGNFYVFSAESADCSAVGNVLRTISMGAELRAFGIFACPVIGTYQGTVEHSYLVSLALPNHTRRHDEIRRQIFYMAFQQYTQECVLHVDHDMTARLLYNEQGSVGEVETLGTWYALDNYSAARDAGDFTCDLSTGQAYAVR